MTLMVAGDPDPGFPDLPVADPRDQLSPRIANFLCQLG